MILFKRLFRRSAADADSKVKYIQNMEEYGAMLETSKSKLVVVDFTAKWYVNPTAHTTKRLLSPLAGDWLGHCHRELSGSLVLHANFSWLLVAWTHIGVVPAE